MMASLQDKTQSGRREKLLNLCKRNESLKNQLLKFSKKENLDKKIRDLSTPQKEAFLAKSNRSLAILQLDDEEGLKFVTTSFGEDIKKLSTKKIQGARPLPPHLRRRGAGPGPGGRARR